MASRDECVSATAEVRASPAEVFALIRDPASHALIDGSGTVLGSRGGASMKLGHGDRFHMSMRRGVPYRMWNTVVEFEQDRLIAWRQDWGHHVWRYELEPSGGGTSVTETFDWSTCRAKWLIHAMRAPEHNLSAIRATLRRLQEHFPPSGV